MATRTEPSRPRPSALELLTIPAAMVRLGCSDNHVYRLIAAGELRPVDIAAPGSRRSKTRIRSDDLDAYIERMTRSTGHHRSDPPAGEAPANPPGRDFGREPSAAVG